MDVLVLVGECAPVGEGELAFAPVISALRGVMADSDALEGLTPPLRSALTALWPVPGADDRGDGGREQLFEAVYRVLARLGQRQPVLLAVEDVHWIDRSSRDLLAFLLRNTRRDAIGIVVTYRPDELHRGHPLRPFLAELERSGQAKRVELEPLARSEVAEQLAAIAGHVPAAGVVERIFARCDGNPFFAEELLAGGGTGGGELPGSLREVLLLRFERLSNVTREVLRVAAVVGRSVDHRLLTSVVDVVESELLVAVREATDHHVMVASADGTSYVFRHALLREAIYEDTLVGERLRLHRAIAKTLEAHREYAGAGAAAELAHHWLAAGDVDAGFGASLSAADEAERMHAYDEACRHVRRALELWDGVAASKDEFGFDRIDLLLRASGLADFAGDTETAVALAEQARAGLDESTEPLRAAAAERTIALTMVYGARAADAVEHMAAARRLVPKHPPSLQYLDALSREGRLLMLNSRMMEARERLEAAIPLAEQLGAQAVHSDTVSALAIVYANLGERGRAITTGREAVRLATQSGLPEQICRAHVNGSQAIDEAGRLEEALDLGLHGIVAADRLGMSRGAGDQLRWQAGWRLSRMGRLEDAERVIEPGLDRATSPFNVAGLENLAGHLAAERGEFEVAEPRLERAWELMQRSGGFQLIGPSIAWRASLDIYRGALERASECLTDGLRRVAGSEDDLIFNAEVFWLAVRLAADLAERAGLPGPAGTSERAAENAAAAIAEFDRVIGLASGDGPPPEALAFRALAEAELGRLRGERDAEPWRAAADQFRALSEALRAAYADFRAAEAVALSGRRQAEIAPPLRAAFDVARVLGARPFCEEVEALARRAGIVLESPDRDDVAAPAEFGLSDRELEVLRLIAEGRTNRQIGEQLFITPKTASAHVSHILMKLGVTNRAEAAAVAHRLGLTGAVRAE